jgi:palmitoyltransferase ZDHHC9/14/18
VSANGFVYKMKFCESCNIIRPIRTSHCHDCNNCVMGFDHHCVWLGTCVGKLNYTHFFHFVMATFAYIIMVLTLTCFSIAASSDVISRSQNLEEFDRQRFFKNIPKMIVVFAALFFLVMLGGLYTGHIIFMCHFKKTTNEALKRSEKYGYSF